MRNRTRFEREIVFRRILAKSSSPTASILSRVLDVSEVFRSISNDCIHARFPRFPTATVDFETWPNTSRGNTSHRPACGRHSSRTSDPSRVSPRTPIGHIPITPILGANVPFDFRSPPLAHPVFMHCSFSGYLASPPISGRLITTGSVVYTAAR